MQHRQLAEEILSHWRAAERDLLETPDASLEAEALRDEIQRLRDQYQRLVDDARAASRPELPPFPTEP
jgi:hypothetical protein